MISFITLNDRFFVIQIYWPLLCLSQIKELLNYLNLYVNLVYLLSNCTSLYSLVFNDDCEIAIFGQVDSSGHPRHILGAGRPGAGLLHLQKVSGARDTYYDSQDKLNYPGSVPSVFREWRHAVTRLDWLHGGNHHPHGDPGHKLDCLNTWDRGVDFFTCRFWCKRYSRTAWPSVAWCNLNAKHIHPSDLPL